MSEAQWFPKNSDARELERCATAHARVLERNQVHHQAHAERLNRLEGGQREQDQKIGEVQVALEGVRATQRAHLRIVLVVIPLAAPVVGKLLAWLLG